MTAPTDELHDLRRRIAAALEIVGTATDCQCQGESCPWCDVRRVLRGRESTRHGTPIVEAREAVRRVATDPSADAASRRASLDDLRSLCGHLWMQTEDRT